MNRALLLAFLVACGKDSSSTAPRTADAPTPATPPSRPESPPPASQPPASQPPASQPPASQPASLPTLKERPFGPSMAACRQAAAHLGDLVIDAALGPTPEQRKYLEHMMAKDRDEVVRYCLEVAAPKEIACVLTAKDVPGLAGCDRFRRELPPELLEHKEPSGTDCERLFDRLRGFRIEEGVNPVDIDRDRDQLVRSCQEKAKIGTIACFLASPTYAQARRCP